MRTISVLLAVAAATLAVPTFAADPPTAAPPGTPPATPTEQAKQGVDLLLKALDGWIRQFPTYAAPEVTPEGDIIIRRLDRTHPAPPAAPPNPNATPGGATNL